MRRPTLLFALATVSLAAAARAQSASEPSPVGPSSFAGSSIDASSGDPASLEQPPVDPDDQPILDPALLPPPVAVAVAPPPATTPAPAAPMPTIGADITIEVENPGTMVRGYPWLVRVKAEGPPGVDRVLFHWRRDDSVRFRSQTMEPLGDGLFETRVPGVETDVAGIHYYLTAWDRAGLGFAELGSAETPRRLAFEAGRGAHALGAAAVLAALAAALVAIRLRFDSGRRRHDLDQLFWVVTLRPLATLDEIERERRLRELAGVDLHHPTLGLRRFPLAQLRRRLAEVSANPSESLVPGDLLAHRCALELAARSQS